MNDVISAALISFQPETGLLSKQLNEKKAKSKSTQLMGFGQKEAQLIKRRRYRAMRKHFVVHSLKRKAKIASISKGKRAMTLFKANRKRKKTMKLFKRRRKGR